MKIDGTRLKAFWNNPERYRLTFQLDIAPAILSYGLGRGIVFHTVLNLSARGANKQDIDKVLLGQEPDYDGRFLKGLTPTAIANGKAMAEAYLAVPQDYEILASELEFDFEIADSPHSGVGRIDQIIKDRQGKHWVLEFKTANAKAQYGRKVDEWVGDMQADFEILGSRSLGYDVEGVRVQYVVENTPPRVWVPMYVTRTENMLYRSKLKIHQTCENIMFYLEGFGKETPWPHLANWPCSGDCGYCGFESLCGHQGPLDPDNLPGYRRREEHLEILRTN